MKRKNRNIIIIALLILTVLIYNAFLSQQVLIGKYCNRNYGNAFVSGIPHVNDTLILYENNDFYSKYYGRGTFIVSYGLDGTKIKLIYNDGFGSTYLRTSVNRKMFFGHPKIDLHEDFNQYYEKIE